MGIHRRIYSELGFEWDEEKDRANTRKHLISFQEAKTVFDGEVLTVVDNRADYGEGRLLSLGELELERETVVIVVAHTKRGVRTRIISARRANRKERRKYHDYIER